MQTLRGYLAWLYAIAASVCFEHALFGGLRIFRARPHASTSSLLLYGSFSAAGLIFGLAWFTVWRGKPSGRFWGLFASLIYFVAFFRIASHFPYSVLGALWLIPALGLTGLIAFARRYQHSVKSVANNTPLPGDGTSTVLRYISEALVIVTAYGLFSLWSRGSEIARSNPAHSRLPGIVVFTLVLFLIVTLHELGHTLIGLALGMKLRSFQIGVFESRIREGRWEFHLNLEALLSGGSTGVVPATSDFPRQKTMWMVAAGPLVSLLTGAVALWIASTATPGSSVKAAAVTALFGSWSLGLGLANLVPFRTGDYYSDGAHLYQLLSSGPWADFHRAISIVASSTVTPLRPRDYDIDAIRRAAQGITAGREGVLLRLFAYFYFLDSDRPTKALQMLQEAESIYAQSPLHVPAELFTVFVFGNACLRHDAAASRVWWTRMVDKKLTRFNADYWMAAAALHWVEGNPGQAHEAWEKGHALALRLPRAGAYEFDRYCYDLLRKSFTAVAAAT